MPQETKPRASATGPQVPPEPVADSAGPTDPAIRMRPALNRDPYRGLTKIRDDYTALLPSDPRAPAGPNPDKAAALALMKAKVRQRKKRRVGRGRFGQDAATGDGYVKTASTQAKLLQRGSGLFARYRRELGLHNLLKEDCDPCDFVVWLFSLKPMLAVSSWRIYRASALAWLQTVPHARLDEALATLEADIGIGADAGRARPLGRAGGPARSELAMRFGCGDFAIVMNEVHRLSRSAAVPWLADWLVAGVHTGLRPSEWAATVLEVRSDPGLRQGRRAWLHVLDAEARTGAVAVQRTLDISNFSAPVLDAVRRHSERANAWLLTDKFEMRYSQCAQLLYDVCSVLFPRQQQRYSLFSLRHQFIANMKTIYQPAEVAALVGNIGNDETVKHYSKRRVAWLSKQICEVPVPMPEQVIKMRRQWELYEQRRMAKELRRKLRERRCKVKARRKS